MNTRVVEVPPELVSVTLTVYVPAAWYVCVVTGDVVVAVVRSPKFQAQPSMVPKVTVDVDVSNVLADPAAAGVTKKRATGA